MPTHSQATYPTSVPSNSPSLPWIRASVKVSHATGSPIVDWSKIQLSFRVQKVAGQGMRTAVSLVFRVANLMEMSLLRALNLELKDAGVVSVGDIASGSSAESAPTGPVAYVSIDSPREIKGTMGSGDCKVPFKIVLPVSSHFSPTVGLSLEQVANELASSPMSSYSTKLAISKSSGGPDKIKGILQTFLGMAEVEPEASGPSNGTFACSSNSGVPIRLLAKIKKDKVKIDLKCTNPQIAESVMSDLKRLIL